MKLTRRIQGVDLHLNCVESLAPQGQALLDTFERLYSAPGSLRAGAQIRFGWSLLRILEDDEGLVVGEPDFERRPGEVWIPTVDTTLAVETEQVRLLHRLRISGQDTYFDSVLFAASGSLDLDDVFLKRSVGTLETDSGWALGSLSNPEALTEGELEPVPISRLVVTHRFLMQALALPTGSIAIYKNRELHDVLDETGHTLFRSFSEDSERR
ncbi:MAG: hypothetical protein WBM14_14415 [Terracidiphilus sp.]